MRRRHALRGWLRRAETIQRKAEVLLHDIMAELGADHSLTDDADNVVHQAEDLSENIGLRLKPNWKGE
jgi:hypothetical protein